ncbi:hypothetical protein DV26_01025 [Amycolatopsis mediterranei]|nr:hypothetical protein DV26_01025 [Amycolatopsis mediterranei]
MFRFFLVDEPPTGDLTHVEHRHAQQHQLQLSLLETTSIQALEGCHRAKPCSREFRDDVVAVVRRGDASLKQVVKDFRISESYMADDIDSSSPAPRNGSRWRSFSDLSAGR